MRQHDGARDPARVAVERSRRAHVDDERALALSISDRSSSTEIRAMRSIR